MTTSAGHSVADHQSRERIPERTVHARGSTACGKHTITQDITQCSKAASN